LFGHSGICSPLHVIGLRSFVVPLFDQDNVIWIGCTRVGGDRNATLKCSGFCEGGLESFK
jgi:hypothetical protein